MKNNINIITNTVIFQSNIRRLMKQGPKFIRNNYVLTHMHETVIHDGMSTGIMMVENIRCPSCKIKISKRLSKVF
jgi:hypothetical protein